jgi:hypothetical protein
MAVFRRPPGHDPQIFARQFVYINAAEYAQHDRLDRGFQ